MIDSRALIEVPFVFTQTKLLTPQEFARAARDRDVFGLVEPFLEALHQTRILQPLYRVSYDVRRYVRFAARHRDRRWEVLGGVQRRPDELVELHAHSRVRDPANSRFVPWSRYEREWEDVRFRSSDFLYSHYQLVALPFVRALLPRLKPVRRRDRSEWTLLDRHPREVEDALTFRRIAISACALDAYYRPGIIGWRHYPGTRDFKFRERYRDWVAQFDPAAYLTTLGIGASDVKDMALFLLKRAGRIDPFGDWLDLIAAGTPDKWDRLLGDGRISMELRVAAELLLRFYEDLVSAGGAEPLEESAQGFRGPFDGRVGRRNHKGSLDALLSPFGLSPHPRLVLVVEGETERRLLPRLLPLLGMRLEDEFIRFVDREGVTRDIDALVRFAATPRVEAGNRADYVTLTRPTTRILVAMDPHGRLESEEGRRREKDAWIDRIHTALAREYAVPVPRSELEHLVEVAVWPDGDSFEFAHFTDLELAAAMCRQLGSRCLSVAALQARVAKHRAERKDIKTMLPRGKADLADLLWPTLRRRVVRAQKRGTHHRIPAVQVLERARQIVLDVPSGETALALREPVADLPR
jgi:hypothetical protein